MARYKVTGIVYYSFVERSNSRRVVEMIVECDNQDEARYAAIDKTIESIDEDEVEERFSELKVQELEPPPPPATDATIWTLPRDIAPTLFPEEMLQ